MKQLFWLWSFFLLACEDSISTEGLKNITQEEISINNYCALGASTASMGWQREVAKNLNAKNYKNYAIGGTRWTHTALSVVDYSANASENPHNKIMTNQLARLLKDKQELAYEPDVITIMCGLNDAATGPRILGSFEETLPFNLAQIQINEWTNEAQYKKIRETVFGATRYVVEQLKLNFPNAKIVILTVQQVDNGTYNNENATFVNNVLKNIANRYDCNVIDVFNESGIVVVKDVPTIYLQADRLHPSAEGEKLLTKYVTEKLRQLLN